MGEPRLYVLPSVLVQILEADDSEAARRIYDQAIAECHPSPGTKRKWEKALAKVEQTALSN